jgi:hypothetical protein
MVTVPSWDPRDQGHWLSALRRQEWVQQVRVDGRANLLTVARLVALHASWETLESRPTWVRLLARSGLSERTVARWLQELRVRGWLAHLEHGSTPAHRPSVLAHLSGNRAAVYGLRIPLSPQEALHRAVEQLADHLLTVLADQDPPADVPPAPSTPDQHQTAPLPAPPTAADDPAAAGSDSRSRPVDQHLSTTSGDINGTPSWSVDPKKISWVSGFSRARESVDNQWTTPTDTRRVTPPRSALRAGQDEKPGLDWATTMPASRFGMLIAADWLRRQLPVFASCSRKLIRHLCKPHWRAGWTNRDIVHAMDHRPGLFGQPAGVLISPDRIAAPKAFIASRLAAWRTPEGAILPGHWTTRVTDAATTSAARAQIAARHGRAGAALLRPGENALTADRITEHGHAARPPASPATRAAAKAALVATLAQRSRPHPLPRAM